MTPIKSLFLTLSLLAMFAVDGFAQCSGKTVHLQVPSGWYPNDKINYLADNAHNGEITATREGNWLVFKFTSFENDGAGKGFAFYRDNGTLDNGSYWISPDGYNQSRTGRPGNKFSCGSSTFGSGSDVYIYENPLNLGKVLTSPNPPNARYFYLLPPADWITYSPYFWYGDGNTPKRMSIDADRCGWYKMVFFGSTVVPDDEGLIIFSPKKPNDANDPDYREALGLKGMDETDFTGGIPTTFNLKHMFDSLLGENQPGSIFFTSEGPYNRWSKNDPMIDEPERCSYNLAAVIYYKGQTGNSFTHYADQGGDAEGVCKGYVQPELKNGKMQWAGPNNRCSPYGWDSQTDFENAFKKTTSPYTNQQLCYDMPFQRRTGGLWEFDALYLCRNGSLDFTGTCSGSSRVGGFYLPDNVFQSAGASKGRTYGGDFGVGPQACFNKWCYDRGWIGGSCDNMSGGANSMGEGNLDGLTTAAAINAEMRTYCRREVQQGDFNGYGSWLGTMPGGSSPGNVTGLLCFESHANFTYEKGQEFFFRGDDDIWVFINNRLVIDLGGNHGPAPGYVKLDTISNPSRLVEGDDYPIDIFFCDRRAPGANVRISTDMYIKSKNLLYTEPDRGTGLTTICAVIDESGTGCAAAMGGGSGSQTMCGSQISGAYAVEFYAVNKDNPKDTVWLKNNSSRCSGSEKTFSCYDGIKVNNAVYSCGNKTKCQKDQAATELVKNWPNSKNEYIVYVSLTKNGTRLRSAEIDRITPIPADAKMVWGTLTDIDNASNKKQLMDSYNIETKERQEIIAGRRTPIYVASGDWNNGTFNYATDSEGSYSIANCGNLKNSGLTLYKSKDRDKTDEKCGGNLPKGGIDTLWAEGAYSIGTKTFELNTEMGAKKNNPTLKLTVYQPELRFMESDFKTPVAPDGYAWFGYSEPPYVTSPLDIYIAAWDPRKNLLCDHCSFSLDQTSATNNVSLNQVGGEGIVLSDKLQMKDGKLTTSIAGYYQVLDPDKASWTVYYRDQGYGISAQWTNLEFKDAPVPMPKNAHIYDRNGDGIGDSLRVEFSKSFRDDKGNVRDSALLVLLEVIWDKGDTIRYHLSEYPPDSLKKFSYVEKLYKNPKFFEKNLEYWKERVEGDNVIVLKDNMFSKDILTYAYFNDKSDKSKIISYTPFNDDDLFTYSESGFPRDIFDSIPPIVIKAVYTADEDPNCMNSGGCREGLEVHLSEPVFAIDSPEESSIKNPFSYCLRSQQLEVTGNNSTNCPTFLAEEDRHSQAWNNLDWSWELPGINPEDTAISATYAPNKHKSNEMNLHSQEGAKGDSIVKMVYKAVKINDNTKSRMPKGSDWVKIRGTGSVFVDAAGNKNNPREIGVLITGKNYYTKTPVKIGAINPNEKSPIRDIFEGNGNKPWWMDDIGTWADSLFNDKYGRITELLPIPKDISFSDTAKYYYPGTIGIIFGVADNIRDKVDKIKVDCKTCTTINGIPFSEATDEQIAEGISMYASAYYHTNLGDYTAHTDPGKEPMARCTDPVFKNEEHSGNCLSNAHNLYLAWDMKTNKGRFVGTGAYVAIVKFSWQLEYKKDNAVKVDKFKQDEFIEMLGVRRKSK